MRIRLPALLVYFASGFAALLYQVVWQRTLGIFSGTDVRAATIVVAAFMAGLGCGSFAGGSIADRLSRRASLLAFAAAELAIGAFGAISALFFYRVLYLRLGGLGLGARATAAILFASLLWPTFFMGASLPLVARALATSVYGAAATVGALYACNTLGAAFGALCATWVFLPLRGIEGTLRVAVAVNVGCALAALPFAAMLPRASSPADRVDAAEPQEPAARDRRHDLATGAYAALFALSGFLALSFEIVWFRLLGVMLKGTTYVFGSVLAVYLLSLGSGAAAGSALARRVRRPAAGFCFLQAAAGVYAVLALSIFVAGLGTSPALQWFAERFRGSETIDVRAAALQLAAAAGLSAAASDTAWPSDFLRLYVLLPVILIGPAVWMMGASFPLLQKAVHRDLAHVGRRVGLLLSANIAGSTAGAFVTGWTLLDRLGTTRTLLVLVAISGVFAVVAQRASLGGAPLRVRASRDAVAALAFVGVAASIPDTATLWAALHGTTSDTIISAEDSTGVAVLRVDESFTRTGAQRVVVFANGLGQSWIPYGDIHTQLGAVPAFFHPRPRTAAIIGLGSGDTLYAIAGRRGIERITSIEIVRPQLATLEQLTRLFPYPPLQVVVRGPATGGGPAIEHVSGDGRLYLTHTARRFDIIEADALRPSSAYSGHLYSDAYFELVRSRLNPGGLAVTWAPTERVARTFLTVFPHAWRAGDILLGSNDPIDVDREAIWQRISERMVVDHFRWGNIDILQQMRPYVHGPSQRYGPAHDRTALVDINTDLFPKDEFSLRAVQ
jgi:spermidine synthase